VLDGNADLDGVAGQVEIAGPGFINITLDDAFLAAALAMRTLVAPGPAADTWWWTTPAPTWPRKCTSATCAAPSSATPWPGCWRRSGTG
jgi:hypothetical protein